MKEKKHNFREKEEKPKKAQHPDDSIKQIENAAEETPEIYKIKKRGKSIDRKDFILTAASISGIAALGTLFQGCDKSEFDIVSSGDGCACHAVCTCNSEQDDYRRATGDRYEKLINQNQDCTCDTVCTCNSVCSCDTVCACDSEGGGSSGGGYSYTYYYTYWYPN